MTDATYRPLYMATALERGEFRDLPGGRARFCCIDCGEMVDGPSPERIPDHGCLPSPSDPEE